MDQVLHEAGDQTMSSTRATTMQTVDYVVASGIVVYWHGSRSILLNEIPASTWIRGEHIMGSHSDGMPRCISSCSLMSSTATMVAMATSTSLQGRQEQGPVLESPRSGVRADTISRYGGRYIHQCHGDHHHGHLTRWPVDGYHHSGLRMGP